MNESLDELYTQVYEQLRSLASKYMRRERSGHTLQTTALVNEAYCALSRDTRIQYQDRRQVIAAAAGAMRRILVNHAIARRALKRGGGWVRVTLAGIADQPNAKVVDMLALDQALKKLASHSKNGPRMVRLVELKFFVGLTDDEAAEILRIASRTARRIREYALAWLQVELSGSSPDGRGE